MIDLFTLALTHGLIVLALWRLLFRPELDDEAPRSSLKPWRKDAHGGTGVAPGDA